LGVEEVLDEELRVKVRECGYSEGQAIKGLVYNLVGGNHLSDEALRGDPGAQELLAAATILAPTTAGEFLRKFDIGDVHDLQRGHLRLHQGVRAHKQTKEKIRLTTDGHERHSEATGRRSSFF
jgi:hypothetical protein